MLHCRVEKKIILHFIKLVRSQMSHVIDSGIFFSILEFALVFVHEYRVRIKETDVYRVRLLGYNVILISFILFCSKL